MIIPRSSADLALSSDPLDGLLLPENYAKKLQINVSGSVSLMASIAPGKSDGCAAWLGRDGAAS